MRLQTQPQTWGTSSDMSDTPDYVNGEPEPVHNFNPSVHDLLVNDAKHHSLGFGIQRISDSLVEQMIDLFRARKAYGLNKYGTILQAENGRDFTKDAIDEIVDFLAYVRQGLEEHPKDIPLSESYAMGVRALKHILIHRERSTPMEDEALDLFLEEDEAQRRAAKPVGIIEPDVNLLGHGITFNA